MDFQEFLQPHPMLPEVGIQDGPSYDPMDANSLSVIVEGVQQHFPQHPRALIVKYYEVIEKYFSMQFSDNGSGNNMVSRICALIHKVQKGYETTREKEGKITLQTLSSIEMNNPNPRN